MRMSLQHLRPGTAGIPRLVRRLLHFWIVWTALLFVHEGGHALVAHDQGLELRRVTVGMGPEVWRGSTDAAEFVVRLIPLAGITTFDGASGASVTGSNHYADGVGGHAAVLGAGIAATLLLAIVVAGVVAVRERATGRRSVWARAMLADAVVLSVFNLLPVPPLDGGRAALDVITAVRGTPLSGDALFWLQAGGLALAVVPMTLWTRWTARIDRVAMRWGAPVPRAVPHVAGPEPRGAANDEPRAAA